MKVKFADLSAQYLAVKEDFDVALLDILATAGFIGGKHLLEFENSFASYISSQNCIGVGNGTDALEIILEAALPAGSRIALPANSFIATAEAVTRSGHHPVLLDVDETYNLSLDSVTQAVERGLIDAVILVHLYGRPVSSAVIRYVESKGIPIFEDCAQAHGAVVDGRRIGTIGIASSFSFFPGKNLGAFGDAGAICTSDPVLAERCRRIRNHGRLGKFDHEILGRNSRLDAIQAAILNSKMKMIEQWTQARRVNAELYRFHLSSLIEVTLPPEDEPGMESVYHHFVLRLRDRDALIEHLRFNDIETGIHYPEAISMMQPFAAIDQTLTADNAELFSRQIVSLPIGEHLTPEQIAFVSLQIRNFISGR